MRTRRFTQTDQLAFAGLSGDCNPLHFDPVVARRTLIGGVAVHGIHLVLWALDEFAAQARLSGFHRLRVLFDRAALVDEDISLDWHDAGDRLIARLQGPSGNLLRITMVPQVGGNDDWVPADNQNALACESHVLAELDNRSGELPLTLPDVWKALFPNLAGGFAERQLAMLLGTTRLVGMICPGLHSIYSALELENSINPDSDIVLRYHVIRADRRVHLVDMAVNGAGLRGMVSAFVRPPPYRQPPLGALLKEVAPNAFTGQRAVIVGGSRGLGELAAKLLCAGGAAVTITWQQGLNDARAIALEAAEVGRTIEVAQFDIAAPPQAPPPGAPFTHLYYFATSRISAGRPGQFDTALFSRMIGFYVVGLARCVAWFEGVSTRPAYIWYPSTIFLQEPDPHFAEYAAAKACGEQLCERLNAQLTGIQITVDRLPRLPTDQTQALTESGTAHGAQVMASVLLHCARGGR